MFFSWELVGGLEHEFYFPFHIWDVILPIDERIFFKMVTNHQPAKIDVTDVTLSL